jgi:hypothetical protein
MSLFRLILIAIAAFFAFRFVRSVMKFVLGPRGKGAEGETVRGRKQTRPLEKPFRDAKDASFEDLSGAGSKQVHRDPPS